MKTIEFIRSYINLEGQPVWSGNGYIFMSQLNAAFAGAFYVTTKPTFG